MTCALPAFAADSLEQRVAALEARMAAAEAKLAAQPNVVGTWSCTVSCFNFAMGQPDRAATELGVTAAQAFQAATQDCAAVGEAITIGQTVMNSCVKN